MGKTYTGFSLRMNSVLPGRYNTLKEGVPYDETPGLLPEYIFHLKDLLFRELEDSLRL
jgi:hypothetical protein